MKRSFFVALGLTLALSVGAQTNPDENKDKKEKAKAEESAKPGQHKAAPPWTQPREHKTGMQSKSRERTEAGDQQTTHMKTHGSTTASDTHESTGVKGQGTATSKKVTVFRNGRETSENLVLHRSTREKTDVHFSIGTHPREWWLASYTIVLMEGCHYYLADNGCWYPAYGFDPSCNYTPGLVFCE